MNKLGLQAIVLEEKRSQGRTVIEKFQDHAHDAGYAVVLLTADDEGRRRNTAELRPRARQNVIFELGFFYGTLGRHNVAVLCDEHVELPSDLAGVVYIPLDQAGTWKALLERELMASEVSAQVPEDQRPSLTSDPVACPAFRPPPAPYQDRSLSPLSLYPRQASTQISREPFTIASRTLRFARVRDGLGPARRHVFQKSR